MLWFLCNKYPEIVRGHEENKDSPEKRTVFFDSNKRVSEQNTDQAVGAACSVDSKRVNENRLL